ncbi:glycosyl hydrolase family 18 protein [Streptomyces sp. UNOC14_S4]|uniref:glycosyl hydrolase family 18 protein n=1 Tax=Streptomyces sp. UNOC14_S4 TaxID=2872340 RepID=UPI001E2B4962|nr:glycosyl hydrolase family 18 protein [Streptomyces sp. UNOC14_S4]MCC3769257.1 carbohydrate binding domain-containing protein [Streptomyces sp. UNOC14_S4]
MRRVTSHTPRRIRPVHPLLTAFASLAAAAGLALGGGTAHAAAHAEHSPPLRAAATPLPAHVFAPYFESWTSDSPAALAARSGAKHLTMAFLQTEAKGSCTPYWNGDTGKPVSSSVFGSDITTIRAGGGDVIPSFGGYAADNGGTELADSCADVGKIAAAYENVVTTYGVSRLDLDIEDNSLTNSAGVDRRNKAIKQVQDWAASTGRTLQFSYTLPTTTHGLADSGLAVLRNAVSNGARVDVVNIMTFDYYDGATHDMAADTRTAAEGLHGQLAGLYPAKSSAELWAMTGVTEMPGIDDYGPAETFTTQDAPKVYDWAVAQGIGTLSFWALQRDNGGCPGTKGSDSCSGIAQDTWYFTHTFAPFTGGGSPTTPDFSLSVSPAAASVPPGGTATATVNTAVVAGSAQTVALTASGAPAGVTVSLSPSSVTAGASAQLTVTVGASAAPGSYPVTVRGTAPSGAHTATYTLTVTGGGSGGGLGNGDFETGGTSPWTCQAGSTVVSSPVHGGGHALQVTPSADRTGQCEQTVTLAPNTAHTLTGWVRGPYAYVGVSGGANASQWASSDTWTQLTVPFTTDASGKATVYVHGWYGQGAVYADDFSLT